MWLAQLLRLVSDETVTGWKLSEVLGEKVRAGNFHSHGIDDLPMTEFAMIVVFDLIACNFALGVEIQPHHMLGLFLPTQKVLFSQIWDLLGRLNQTPVDCTSILDAESTRVRERQEDLKALFPEFYMTRKPTSVNNPAEFLTPDESTTERPSVDIIEQVVFPESGEFSLDQTFEPLSEMSSDSIDVFQHDYQKVADCLHWQADLNFSERDSVSEEKVEIQSLEGITVGSKICDFQEIHSSYRVNFVRPGRNFSSGSKSRNQFSEIGLKRQNFKNLQNLVKTMAVRSKTRGHSYKKYSLDEVYKDV